MEGSYLVTRASAARWFLPHDIPEAAYLTNIRVNLRLAFTRETSSAIFFFFHSEPLVYTPLSATLSFAVKPYRAAPALPASIDRWSALPPFVLTGLRPEEIAQFGPAGATAQNTVFFALGDGQDILAVMHPQMPKRAAVRFSPNRIPGPQEPIRKRFTLRAFLALMDTLKKWVDDGEESANAQPSAGPASPNAVSSVLNALTEAFLTSSRQLSLPAEPLASAPDLFRKYHRIDEFSASLRMRLRPDGSLAEESGDERLHLRARFQVDRDRSLLTMGIPDFFATGQVRDAYLNELAYDSECRSRLVELSDLAIELQVPAYISSARQGAVVIRILGETTEQALIWLPGTIGGSPAPILLSGVFRVDGEAEPFSVTLHRGRDLNRLRDPLDARDAAPFFALVRAIQLWTGLLQ